MSFTICSRILCSSKVMPFAGNVKLVANLSLKDVLDERFKFRNISTSKSLSEEVKTVKITIAHKGKKTTIDARVGGHFLDAVTENKLKIVNYGSCGGALLCSSCHLMFTPEVFKALKPMNGNEENRIFDAPNLTDESRLGCQVIITEAMDGIEVIIPDEIWDMRGITGNGNGN